MTTILFTFIAALLFSLTVTPWVKKLALRFNLVDKPSDRKIHRTALPRIGGVVIFLSFFIPFLLLYPARFHSVAARLIFTDARLAGFVTGAVIIFVLGLVDDIRRLSWPFKFAGQTFAALVAYFWGFQITIISIPFSDGLQLGFFAMPVTVFWFVLVINAINLIDGLDGLAAGISLFVSLTMLVICATTNHIVEALAFASLAGTLIGFLKYNFNPASIFMGDCGSYFLGFCLAAFSVAGSLKGQFATTMLIPVIALGVPLIDTLWAPLRRFVFGRKIFQPDSEHFHHRLVRLGYTQRRAVLLIYGITIILGIGAIGLVHAQNDMAALILFVLGIGVICITRYFGVSDFITLRRMINWVHDLSDEAGVSHDRRSFLNHQRRISKAADFDDLWQAVGQALASLEFDCGDLSLQYAASPAEQPGQQHFHWQRDTDFDMEVLTQNCVLKIELPLHSMENKHCRHFGTLLLVKDMTSDLTSHYTLKRVEHLRRTIVSSLMTMENSLVESRQQ
jgi:UDP-GlcNAc:undecaprenyl-phosphate GlcNAc-1-phosphate transferase